MKRSRILFSVLIVVVVLTAAAFVVNWKVYNFYTPTAKWLAPSGAWLKSAVLAKVSSNAAVADDDKAGSKATDQSDQDDDKNLSESADPEPAKSDDETEPDSNPKKEDNTDSSDNAGDKGATTLAKTASPEKSRDPNDPNAPNDPNDLSMDNRDPEGNDFRGDGRYSGRGRDRDRGRFRDRSNNEDRGPADANEDPNNPMEALNLKDVGMKDLIAKLADWTGMVVIASEDAMNQKLTIYSPKKLPRDKALEIIYAALKAKGFVVEQTMDNMITIKALEQAVLGAVPTIAPEVPLATIANKNQVVQKFFKMKSYSALQMSQLLYPLIGKYGYVTADDNTGDLQIIDTVENLMRFERMITQLDIPDSEKTITEVFEIKNGDPAEIVQLIEMLMGDGTNLRGGRSSSSGRSSGRSSSRSSGRSSGSSSRSSGSSRSSSSSAKVNSKGGEAKTVTIESVDIPIVLIPEPSRKWIIAKGSADDIEVVGEWIKKLDSQEALMAEYETVQIQYALVDEVVRNLQEAMRQMPGSELEASVLVQGMRQNSQVVIYGRKDLRDVIKQLILEIDIPSKDSRTQVFKLKHADATEIQTNLEGLYETQAGYSQSYSRGSYRSRSVDPKDTIKVVAFPTRQEVTVIASPENLEKIAGQIAEWDVPVNADRLKPRIIELKNSDPLRMAELLTKLFSEESTSSTRNWWPWGRGNNDDQQKKIVGPLYGQLTFEAVPDTKKIIVISKIPQGYDVIESLIAELDSREKADVPKVVTLKYADSEDLCDQLNAILNEPGTRATIRRSSRGLSQETVTDGETSSGAGQDNSGNTGEITPWWSGGGGSRTATEEMPISNIIGRIRFIPVHRSKAILVLAPPEYMDDIGEMIDKLDQPGKQVMVKAIIVEVNHNDMTSLGLKLASDPGSLGGLSEGALTLLNRNDFSNTDEIFGGILDTAVGFDLNVLVDLLIKETNGRVLNQPTLWTKDNEEAEFFRGRNVSFAEGNTISTEGGSSRTDYSRTDVGVKLRVRPNITPEKDVDLTVKLKIDQIEQETISGQPVTSKLDTTTHLIVGDGQTIMLGGILYKNKTDIVQKVPLIGDVPLVGELFRHNDELEANSELLIFITPYVIDSGSSDMTLKEIEQTSARLRDILKDMDVKMDVNPGKSGE